MYGVLRILEPESRLRRGDLLPTVGLGCLGIAVGQTAFTFGLSLTTAANTGLIFATALCGACCWASRSGSRGPP